MKFIDSVKCLFMKKDERGIEEDIISIKYKCSIFFIIFTLIITLLTSYFFINFSNKTKRFRDDVAVKRITNSSTEINKYVSFSIDDKENQLNALKLLLENKNPTKTNYEIIETYLTSSSFDKIGFIKEDGYYFSETDIEKKLGVASSLVVYDESAISLTIDISNDNESIYFCYKYDSSDSSIKGIVGSILVETFSKSIGSSIYNSSASILLVKTDGTIIAKTSEKYSDIFTTNIISDFSTCFTSSFDLEEYTAILQSRDTRIVELKSNKEDFEVYTSDIKDYNNKNFEKLNLRLVVMAPKEELVYQIEGVTSLANLALIISILLLLVTVLLGTITLVYKIIKAKRILAYDDRTGLLEFEQFKHDSYALLKRTKSTYAFCYFNIINFKSINQLQGVDHAEKLIVDISKDIDSYFKDYGIYSYIGADHFELCIKYDSTSKLEELLVNFNRMVSEKFYKNPNTTLLSMGIKITKFENIDSIDDEIFRSKFAEEMLDGNYHSSYISYFSDSMYDVEKENAEYLAAAPHALINHEFEVYFQLKRDISNNAWSGAEALVRWNKDKKGIVPPGKFISLFEENGFIIDLDLYVFEEVCKKIRESIDNAEKIVPISINLSKKHFINPDFLSGYSAIVKKYDVPHELIEFEITEGLIMENMASFVKFILNVHEEGYSCSMDDFGSGYSSLNIIQELDFDIIKIDSRFFKGTKGFDSDSKIIVSSIIELCHKLGKKVVAEGVEFDDQVQFLIENKCDFIQGYYYSKPMPWDECKKKLNILNF